MQNSMVSERTTGYARLTNMVGFTYLLVGVLYNDFIYAHATLPLASRVTAQAVQYGHAWYGLFATLLVGLYFVGQALFPLLISSRFAASMTLTVLSLLNPEAGYVGILLFTLVYALDGFAPGHGLSAPQRPGQPRTALTFPDRTHADGLNLPQPSDDGVWIVLDTDFALQHDDPHFCGSISLPRPFAPHASIPIINLETGLAGETIGCSPFSTEISSTSLST